MVNIDCVFDPATASCEWDAGFPAISADGKQLAKLSYTPDPSDGLAAVTLEIVDARSLRISATLQIYNGSAGTPDQASPAVRAHAVREAARAQQIIDDGGYRTLVALGSSAEEAGPTDLTAVHAEFDGEFVRAVAPATNRVLWQHRFTTPVPQGLDPDDDCGGWTLLDTQAWWDPPTRLVLVSQTYRTGGCMCPDIPREYSWRAPRARP